MIDILLTDSLTCSLAHSLTYLGRVPADRYLCPRQLDDDDGGHGVAASEVGPGNGACRPCRQPLDLVRFELAADGRRQRVQEATKSLYGLAGAVSDTQSVGVGGGALVA